MTALVEFRLVNTVNNKSISFRAVKPFKNKKTQPSISVPLVTFSSDKQILFRFIGQSRDLSFSFALFDDGVDVSEGTNPSTVITPSEQERYLMDEIFTAEFDTLWTLTPDSGSEVQPGSFTGAIEDIDIDHSNPSIFTGTLSFKEGRLGFL